jgi:hypothetical protein
MPGEVSFDHNAATMTSDHIIATIKLDTIPAFFISFLP